MGRLRDVGGSGPEPTATEISATSMRAEALSHSALVAKRSAEAFLEAQIHRERVLATLSGAGGLLALGLGALAIYGGGEHMIALLTLAGVAALAPTFFALMHGAGLGLRGTEVSYDRAICQAIALHSKRLGDAVGATDLRNVPLSPEAVIAGQLDALFRDLERTKQRLVAAGASTESGTVSRLHERIVPQQTDSFLTDADGRRYRVRIVDISRLDVSVKGTMPPLQSNQEVQIGSRRATVTRIAPGLLTLQFVTPLLPRELTSRLIL